jgi:hypothetical protein
MQRFLKPPGLKKQNTPEESDTKSEATPKSLHEIFQKNGKTRWLQQNNPILLAHFNLINKTLHPERPLAKGVANIALKGTTFPDKRELCLQLAERLKHLESNGEVALVPEPENPYDPYALAVIEKETGDRIGYIPKAKELNKTYQAAMKENRLCGAYILTSKINNFQGSPSAILTLATGWQ